jgi:phosphoribosylglycinamide formyltransferase-1
MIRIAIFASGNGSNARRIAEYFGSHPVIRISLILCNKPGAYVLQRAADLGIPSAVFTRSDFYETGRVAGILREYQIDYLVLAGFLWLIPANLLSAYPGRIVNIHPALLPRYGGKGMYGMKVHEAVVASGDRESGITIHSIDEHYDEGRIIFQARCPVLPGETPETLAEKVHELEHRYFPGVIEEYIMKGMTSD